MTQQWSLRRHVTSCVTDEFKPVLNSKKWLSQRQSNSPVGLFLYFDQFISFKLFVSIALEYFCDFSTVRFGLFLYHFHILGLILGFGNYCVLCFHYTFFVFLVQLKRLVQVFVIKIQILITILITNEVSWSVCFLVLFWCVRGLLQYLCVVSPHVLLSFPSV